MKRRVYIGLLVVLIVAAMGLMFRMGEIVQQRRDVATWTSLLYRLMDVVVQCNRDKNFAF